MLEGFLSDDTEFDVYEENDEFVIEQELEAEQEAETALLLGECDDMDDICDSDKGIILFGFFKALLIDDIPLFFEGENN